MTRRAIVALAFLAGCVADTPGQVRLSVDAVGPGTFTLTVGETGTRVSLTGQTTYDDAIGTSEHVFLAAVPEAGASFEGWSGTDPACVGATPEISIYAQHDGDIRCTATFAAPSSRYSVVITLPDGGVLALTDARGATSSCAPVDSPCEIEVRGDTLIVEGTPDTTGDVVVFDPPCPLESERCVFDLSALDTDGDQRVSIAATFEPAGTGVRLDACVGLSFSYEEPFGGAMYRVAADGRCEVVRNDGMVLGTFALSGGNGFGGDGALAVAGIVAESEWLPSGDLTELLSDAAPTDRVEVPPGRASSQQLTLGFASGLRFVVRVEGSPGPMYTRVTQTVLDARR